MRASAQNTTTNVIGTTAPKFTIWSSIPKGCLSPQHGRNGLPAVDIAYKGFTLLKVLSVSRIKLSESWLNNSVCKSSAQKIHNFVTYRIPNPLGLHLTRWILGNGKLSRLVRGWRIRESWKRVFSFCSQCWLSLRCFLKRIRRIKIFHSKWLERCELSIQIHIDTHVIVVGDSPTDIAAGRCLLGVPLGPDMVKTVEFQTRPTCRQLNFQLKRLMTDFVCLLHLFLVPFLSFLGNMRWIHLSTRCKLWVVSSSIVLFFRFISRPQCGISWHFHILISTRGTILDVPFFNMFRLISFIWMQVSVMGCTLRLMATR